MEIQRKSTQSNGIRTFYSGGEESDHRNDKSAIDSSAIGLLDANKLDDI